jgi:hypothetical protein
MSDSVTTIIELLSKMNNLVYENQKKVTSILESVQRAVHESSRETYEYRVQAYQDIINKINEHSVNICKQREAIVNVWREINKAE